IRSPVVYIEERLFLGLNFIAALERYPNSIPESRLAFGFEGEAPVLLASPRAPGDDGAGAVHACSRTRSLPKWFLSEAQLQESKGDGTSTLRPVRGLQGLLLEGISEERTIEVPSPFLETFARTCAAGAMEKELAELGIRKEALAASAGALRFLELRFPTVLQARQRALILYFCTFNFETHMAVPLLVRHQLYDADTTYGVLQLWDLYGLDWPRASKAGIFLLRAQNDVKPSEAVAVNGLKQRKVAEFRAEWQSAEEDQRRAGLAQLHAERELQRLERHNKKKRNADVEEIMQQLSIVPQQELLDALQSGKLPSGVDSQLVEAWILGNRLNFSGRAVDKKQLAKHAATEKLAIRRLLAAREEPTTRSLGSDRGDKEQREWEARLMDFYGRANAARVAEEAQCLAAARRSQAQGDRRPFVPVPPEPSELASARSEPEPSLSEDLQAAEAVPSGPPGSEPWPDPGCQHKASKARSKELQAMAATFSTRRCFLQRMQKTADVRAVKADKEEQTKMRLDDCKRVWATRTRVLAAKHGHLLEYRRREVDLREQQLQADLRKLRDRRGEELESKRAAILEQKRLEGQGTGLHAIASPTRAATTVRVGKMEAVELMATNGKLATATFSSGTESTRASAMGSTFQELRSLADVTWTESESSGAVASRMASTMLSVQARKRHSDSDERLPMAATDGWQSERPRLPPRPRPQPPRPPRPLAFSSRRAPSDPSDRPVPLRRRQDRIAALCPLSLAEVVAWKSPQKEAVGRSAVL
ncbi:unnamed protein product, partial [Symbiodinium sp. CCMP2456]